MVRTYTLSLVAILVIGGLAAATQGTIGIPGLADNTPIQLTDNTVPLYTPPPGPDQWRVVSYGPNIPGGAYVNPPQVEDKRFCSGCGYCMPNATEPNYYCPNCGKRLNANMPKRSGSQSYSSCQTSSYSCGGGYAGGGYGVFGLRARPFCERRPFICRVGRVFGRILFGRRR